MKARQAFLIAIASLIAVVPAFAHHSFAAEFDETKPITLKGAVSKIEWENPHVYFYIDVKDDKGNAVTWGFEGGSPAQLLRSGWMHTTLTLGEQVTVDGFLAKDGSDFVGTGSITLADGSRVRGGAGAPGDFGRGGQDGN